MIILYSVGSNMLNILVNNYLPIYLLRHLATCVNREGLMRSYRGLFHSTFSYGVLMWSHYLPATKVFVIQRRAIRTIVGASHRSECRDFFKQFKVMTLPAFCFYCLLYCLLYCIYCTVYCMLTDIFIIIQRYNIYTYHTRQNTNIRLNHLRLVLPRFSSNYYCINFF